MWLSLGADKLAAAGTGGWEVSPLALMMDESGVISWKRAAGLAGLAVYGPFVVMTLYTVAFVSCSHCKVTAAKIFFCAPGLILVEFARSTFNFSRPADWIWFALAFMGSLAIVHFLACSMQVGRRLRWIGFGVALVLFSVVAYGTLSMIRS